MEYKVVFATKVSAFQLNRSLKRWLRFALNSLQFSIAVVIIFSLASGIGSVLHRVVFDNFFWIIFLPEMCVLLVWDWIRRVQLTELIHGYSTDFYPDMSEQMKRSFAFVNYRNGHVLGRLDQIDYRRIEQIIEASSDVFVNANSFEELDLPRYPAELLRRTSGWSRVNRPLYEVNEVAIDAQSLINLAPWAGT